MKRSVTIAAALSLAFITGIVVWQQTSVQVVKADSQKPKSVLYQEKFGEGIKYSGSEFFSSEGTVNVRVNSHSGVSEPKIAVNPLDGNNFITVSNDFTLSGNGGRLFYSLDGGLNWTTGIIPLSGRSSFEDATDPVITFDADGNAYYAVIHYEVFGSGDGVYVNKSVDKGKTWNALAAEVKRNNDPLLFEDRPAIATDLSQQPTRNNIYTSWTSTGKNLNKILVSASSNGAASFSQPVEIASGNVHTSEIKVDMNGVVYAAYTENDNTIKVARSYDAGKTFSTPVTAAQFQHSGDFNGRAYILKNDGSGNGIRVRSYPVLAVDPQTNALHLVFTAKNGGDKSDIFLTTSDDGGNSWTSAVRVNNDNTSNDQFMPAAAVDLNSNLYIIWQDSRGDVNNILTETFMAKAPSSVILENMKVSTGSFNPSSIMLGSYIGDYNGLAVTGSSVVPVWTDGRNGNFDLFAAVVPSSVTSVSDEQIPETFAVNQNYPNPFNPSTIISYSVPSDGNVRVKLYDIRGSEIAELFNGTVSAGNHTLLFDAAKNKLASGTYIYSVSWSGNSISKKMILTK